MISVEEALALVQQTARPLPQRKVLLREALGLKLSEPIVSKVDSPPFDKSMLDGFAITLVNPSRHRRIVEEVIAGEVPRHAVEPETAISVMTGAPIPDGTEAIVKVEDVKRLDPHTIELPVERIAAGYGILMRGSSYREGEQVLPAGKLLSPIDVALLAEIGKAKLRVTPRPRVAVLATGNELVQAGEYVAAGQITNSNGPMLLALLESDRVASVDLGIGRDEPDELRRLIGVGLESDVLLVTGGVSAGVMDLVPGVLHDLGVEQVFHKVRIKPGKPLWFGVRHYEKRQTLVYGMPGNPVSTLVSYMLMVRPALEVLRGHEFKPPASIRAALGKSTPHRGGRPTYQPSHLEFGDRKAGLPKVTPLTWRGSADLKALTDANALAVLPAGDYELPSGEQVDVVPL